MCVIIILKKSGGLLWGEGFGDPSAEIILNLKNSLLSRKTPLHFRAIALLSLHPSLKCCTPNSQSHRSLQETSDLRLTLWALFLLVPLLIHPSIETILTEHLLCFRHSLGTKDTGKNANNNRAFTVC